MTSKTSSTKIPIDHKNKDDEGEDIEDVVSHKLRIYYKILKNCEKILVIQQNTIQIKITLNRNFSNDLLH